MNKPLTNYLKNVTETFRRLDSRGVMQVARIVELDLKEVFIPLKLRTAERDRLDFKLDQDLRPDESDPNNRERFDPRRLTIRHRREASEAAITVDELLQRSHRLVILGDPGAGKTTLLRYLAVRSAQARLAGDETVPIPLYITLRYFGEWLQRNRRPPMDALLEYWLDEGLAEFGITDPSERREVLSALEVDLSQGWVLFLLDGLDEQRNPGTKNETAEAIRALDLRYYGNSWLVTSRIIGYGGVLSGSFDEAIVQPFEPEDRKAYLNNWFLAVEQREDPAWLLARKQQGEAALPDEFTRQNALRKAEILINQIDEVPGISELAANPLLCTIIALIFLQGGTLPDSRAELYKLCVDTFIFNWEMNKRRRPQDGPQLNKEETQAALEVIALDFHEHRPDNRAHRGEIVKVTENFLVEEGGETLETARAKAENLLSLVSEVAGLFVDRGNDEYGFFHLSFQEYLAARRMTGARRRMRDYIARYCFDPRWREVLRLGAVHQGGKDPETGSEFVEAVLKLEPTPPNDGIMQYRFRFAFMLMREARVERQTAEALWQHWMSLFLEQRHLAFLWLGVLEKPGKLPPCPDAVFTQLTTMLRDHDDWEMHRAAAWALGELKDPRTLDALLQALGDEKQDVRWAAASALGQLKDPRTLDALLQALGDEKEDVRWAAARALGELKDPRTLDALLQALGDEKEDVRSAAVWALGELKDPRALDALLQALGDENQDVRWLAAQALGELKDPRALDALLQALGDEKENVRSAAARALGKLKNPRALDALLRAVADEAADVRWAAAAAFGELKDPRALDALLQALADEKENVRRAAARALGELKNPRALDALLRAVADEDADMRWAAAAAFGELKDPRALDALLQALADEAEFVRRAATQSLESFDLGAPL
ncbi:NACHT domain-containing protein [Methylocaldum sp.]|uniref:NACHT domain-containing protein n=1 Tax=Methylocaldum sp. TaxID=1969727 RepID=UPI002D5A0554|nr:HEAT repeat domain-containing protein [Methylocaldum sp.]HYE34770.1 HEAT repeat domain-containing protein [Methylocaldum sp.]